MKACIVMALAVAGGAAFEQVRGQEVAFAWMSSFDVAEVNAPGDVVDFLLTSTNTHLTNIEEGTIASKNAGSAEIKDYAEKMVNDQRMMLGYIKKMALLRGLILPDHVSDENREGCDKLAGLSGKQFDKKFVKMMIRDSKRNLDFFRKANNSSDSEVREFAEWCVPVVEEHLKRARELRRSVT